MPYVAYVFVLRIQETFGKRTELRGMRAALRAWEMTGCAKIAVKCPGEDELESIMLAAQKQGLPMYFVADAGRTQIAAGSRTVLGLGPAPVSAFVGVSDKLKLM